MRGYSFWPCVVSRDPEGGEFVKLPDSLSKSQKKIHVLFLEYNNQRAWIQLASIKFYKGLKDFKEQKAAAAKGKKKDWECGKRYEENFQQALDYAEELSLLTDDDRLERVLLKYGWVMVEDQEQDGPRKKKRKTVKQDSGELNKSTATDSEADKEMEVETASAPPAVRTSVSSDRRSSVEAESRLDPTPDPPSSLPSSNTVKKKRASSLVASIALNSSSSSSSDGDSDGEDKTKKVLKPQKKVEKRKSSPVKALAGGPRAAVVAAVPTAAAMKSLGEEEFPRVGDLVWGRMAGFPYWPCFVTRSPQGQYCRDAGKGKMSYHAQFFNWNDESGWVNAVIEFDGLDSFKKLAAKKKSDKSFNPAKGAMYKKWEKAAREAEETMGLTRQERAEQYIVRYGGGHMPVKAATPKAKPPPAPKSPAKPKPAAPKKTPQAAPVVKRAPGPASKTGRPVVPLPKRSLCVVEAAEEPLPAGWRLGSRGAGGQTFISPDGKEFLDRRAALAYSVSEASSPARYLQDNSLPAGWRVQSIGGCIYYFTPRGERYDSREKVAKRLEEEKQPEEVVERARTGHRRRPGPRSVMLSREEAGYQSEEETSGGEEEDPAVTLRLPNGLKYRKGGSMDSFLDLDKIFDPSNGGMIEMVQLPDIFLDHPTVSVTESDNEMVISDVDTGEFIAKKIIYD